MNVSNSKIKSMLEVNRKQKEYYEISQGTQFIHAGNKVSVIWDKIRTIQYRITDELGYNNKLFEIHKHWLGDLKGKKVLDLGCNTGNELSEFLAINSSQYYAVDLSKSALSILQNKFEEKGINNARFLPVDILSDEFKEGCFDVIYAKAIFHHFKFFEEFLNRIKSVLNPKGIIICLDPLNTFLPLRIFRAVYRRFQYDSDWEYPFTNNSLKQIEKYFTILDVAGIMGKAKYAIPIYLLSRKYAIKKAEQWVNEDYHKIKYYDKSLKSCLRISLLLRKEL